MEVASQRQKHSSSGQMQIISRCEEVFFFLVVLPLIAFLPAPLAYRLACLRGDWSYRLNKSKRNQIISNLEGAFGYQLSQTVRQEVARDLFRRQSCQTIDRIRLVGKGRALGRLVEIRGLHHLETALATGKGAVICIAHSGSIVSCCSLLGTLGFPLTAVGNMTSNPISSLFEGLLRRFRLTAQKPRHLHRPNIEPEQGAVEAAVQMAEVLRANEVLVISIDVPASQQDRTHAVTVDFLGRKIPLLPGGVSIAQHTGSSLLVAITHRSSQWDRQVLDLIPVPLNGNIEEAFQQCVSLLEAPIRQNLAFWDGWLSTRELIELGLLPNSSTANV